MNSCAAVTAMWSCWSQPAVAVAAVVVAVAAVVVAVAVAVAARSAREHVGGRGE